MPTWCPSKTFGREALIACLLFLAFSFVIHAESSLYSPRAEASQLNQAGPISPLEDWEPRRALGFGTINQLAYSPDGRKLAVASSAAVQILDAATWTVERQLFGHALEVTCVAWSPDSGRIVSGSRDSTIKIWNAQTGDLVKAFTGHTETRFPPVGVLSVSWSPDASKIASGSGKEIRIWDAKTGASLRALTTGHIGDVRSVAWSPDGSKIASTANDNTTLIWDAQDGAILRIFVGGGGYPWRGPRTPPRSFRVREGSSKSGMYARKPC